MTYSEANTHFDKMDTDSKARIISIFEALCRENTLNVYEAFIAAVENECTAIKIELLLRQAKGAMQ